MLQIPPKKGSSVELVVALSGYVSREYSAADADRHMPDFKAMHAMREAALEAGKRQDDSSLQALRRYGAQLQAVESRLPLSESEVNLNFTWFDAFRTIKSAAECNIAFERAAILYNCGSMESRIGSSCERDSDEGIKTACRHYQSAAGYFEFVRQHLLPLLEASSTSDLSDKGLNMAVDIMLAQAQACFYEKAVLSQKQAGARAVKPSIIARLAAQAAAFYESAGTSANGAPMKSSISPDWPALLHYQKLSFDAAAQYWQSIHAKEVAESKASGYGEEIARLQAAERILSEALAHAKTRRITSDLSDSADALLAKVQEKRAAAEKDNRSVYMDVVPAEASLSRISPAPMVKALEPDLTADGQAGKPLFATLLPRLVMHAVEAHRQALRSVSESASDLNDRLRNEARTQLAAVGLPGSIAAHNFSEGFPEPVWQKVQGCQRLGGDWALRQRLADLQAGSQRASSLMADIREAMVAEFRDDDEFRRANPSYEGQPSKHGCQTFTTDLEKFTQMHADASCKDEEAKKQLDSDAFKQDMEFLSYSRTKLDGLMPKGTSTMSFDTSTLSGLLVRLANVITERDRITAGLKETVAAKVEACVDSVIAFGASGKPLVIGHPDGSGISTASVSDELDDFLAAQKDELFASMTAIQDSEGKQASLLEESLSENARFEDARQADAVTMQRQGLIMNVDEAVHHCTELYNQLMGGRGFYEDLISRLEQMKQTVEGYSYAQQMVRREFQENSQAEADSVALARSLAEGLGMSDPGLTARLPASGFPCYSNPPPSTHPETVSLHPFQARSHAGSQPGYMTVDAVPITGNTAPGPGFASGEVIQAYDLPPPAALPTSSYASLSAVQAGVQPSTPSDGPPPPYLPPAGQAYGTQPIGDSSFPPPASVGSSGQFPPPPSFPTPPPSAFPAGSGTGSAPPAPGPAPSPAARRLMEMGFARDQVERALAQSNDNEDAALESLLAS